MKETKETNGSNWEDSEETAAFNKLKLLRKAAQLKAPRVKEERNDEQQQQHQQQLLQLQQQQQQQKQDAAKPPKGE
ncbi:hypothetical protein ETH_00022750 [Eimeria tenella]|uniref:Uncharacterized protein n=1 Tax=Eimeria tenella TaxID=5802 RepID=U6L0Z5_EIMTE|nr:hypothetical protein ETH_00022750 [Eimeria tenella]CDJ43866.1 hypothetical protein ETH_00022750 [Eimeria tenella]|eukprot:XP_013234615.1 hypothetical protein ETH_00022750 [Eimeria tenella]